MKIKFKREYKVKAEDGPAYKEGQVVNVNRASAMHFVGRDAAEIVDFSDPDWSAPESVPGEPDPAIESPDFDAMTKQELLDHASKANIQGVSASLSKDDVLKAVKKAAKTN